MVKDEIVKTSIFALLITLTVGLTDAFINERHKNNSNSGNVSIETQDPQDPIIITTTVDVSLNEISDEDIDNNFSISFDEDAANKGTSSNISIYLHND